jgi:hypothetical protein
MPWYKQFWPWFLIAFPATAVIAGIATVLIALADPDGLVVADYYREGLAINRNLERQRAAEKLGLGGELGLDSGDGKVSLQLKTAAATRFADPATLSLRLVHPTRAQKDLSATLYKDRYGRLSGLLRIPREGRWQVVIEPEDGSWQLSGALALPEQTMTTLSPS